MRIDNLISRLTPTHATLTMDEAELAVLIGALRRFAGKDCLYVRTCKRRDVAKAMVDRLQGSL